MATARKGKAGPAFSVLSFKVLSDGFPAPFDVVQVADPGLLQRYMQLLTKQEQAYVSEGSSETVRKERLLARTLQRTTLAR